MTITELTEFLKQAKLERSNKQSAQVLHTVLLSCWVDALAVPQVDWGNQANQVAYVQQLEKENARLTKVNPTRFSNNFTVCSLVDGRYVARGIEARSGHAYSAPRATPQMMSTITGLR